MKNIITYGEAPELETLTWINTETPLTLSALRGKIVVIHAFQMLCPACVVHGIPQASAIHELYSHEDVKLIGLHTVFEHHKVMTVEALRVFAAEYRLAFPIAVDAPSNTGSIPQTMAAYYMQGTPTLIVIDQQGQIRLNHFGRLSDMQVGNIIGQIIGEAYSTN